MIKYILLLFLILICHVSGDSQRFIQESKIDSLYRGLSIEQKVRSILISLPMDEVRDNKYAKSNWLHINKVLRPDDGVYQIGDDMLIRSAFLNEKNEVAKNQLMQILVRKKGDGLFLPILSPYSLLFHEESYKTIDFFLESTGRLIIPYIDRDNVKQVYQTKLYKLPSNALSSISGSSVANVSPKWGAEFAKGIDFRGMPKQLKEYENPTIEILLANSCLIYTDNVDQEYNALIRLFENNILSVDLLEKSCKKRLFINELLKRTPISNERLSLSEDVNNLVRGIYKKGAVLLENKNIIPINNLVNRSIASIHIGVKSESVFQETLSEYTAVTHFTVDQIPSLDQLAKIRKDLESFNTIIIAVNGDWLEQEENSSLYSVVHQISTTADLILVHLGAYTSLGTLISSQPYKGVLLSYDASDLAQNIAAQIVFGGIAAQGVLAKNISKQWPLGTGKFTAKSRLGFAPAHEKAYPDTLNLIDQFAYKIIRERATPGCCVLVVKGGDIIYNKAFGYHTYDKKDHVTTSDLYDIASVTKIIASVPAVMKMYDEKKLKLDNTLAQFLPRLATTNKSSMRLDDILLHQAGLQAWIPFYLRGLDKDKLVGDLYSSKSSSQYPLQIDTRLYMNKTARYRPDIFQSSKGDGFDIEVSKGLMMNKSFIDSMKAFLDTSKVQDKPKYLYSDLGYYYIKEIAEKNYNMSLDVLLENSFYKPLGATRLLYKPLRYFSIDEIIPTENDISFRKEVLHGYVHDPGAAMLGGVGGHAGVFASAPDLAKMLQMYLNYGTYGGERYIDSTTMQLFSSVYKEGNRRGLGFDKPLFDPKISGPSCREASASSFGHSGFTGTLVWVDPEYDLIYIFLSNRIHPDQYNKKLISDGARTRMQSAVYRSLPEYWESKKRVKP